MTQKPSRWYEINGETLYVYDAPWRDCSLSVSIVNVRDLPYYRANFRLRKLEGVAFII